MMVNSLLFFYKLELLTGGILIRVNKIEAGRILFEKSLPLHWRLCWDVSISTGLRISDVLKIQRKDLKKRMTITEQKTGKLKLVELEASLLHELKTIAGAKWVFTSPVYPERPLTRSAAWKAYKKAARDAHIGVNIGTHSGRKTYAINLLKEGYTLEQVQKELNHKYITVTLSYILGTDIDTLADMLVNLDGTLT